MYRYLFNKVKNIIPKISDTEMIALRIVIEIFLKVN